MARVASLDKKITDYLTRLTIRQKTLLAVAKTFAEEYQEVERWDGRLLLTK